MSHSPARFSVGLARMHIVELPNANSSEAAAENGFDDALKEKIFDEVGWCGGFEEQKVATANGCIFCVFNTTDCRTALS